MSHNRLWMVGQKLMRSIRKRENSLPQRSPSSSIEFFVRRYNLLRFLRVRSEIQVWEAVFLASISLGCGNFESSAPRAEPNQVPVVVATAPESRDVQFDQERLIRAVARSDDASIHLVKLGGAAQKLVRTGKCTVAEFEEEGGWVRSVSRGAGWYFIYCGGDHRNNRIYFNVHREIIVLPDSQ